MPIWHSSPLKFKISSVVSTLNLVPPVPTHMATQQKQQVRAFKDTLHDLRSQIGSALELKQVTVRELLRTSAAVRNSMVTYGGKALVELVFFFLGGGRRPRDIVTIENSSPEQLSVPVSSLDQMDQTLQKFAMKSYLEARQRADIIIYIAARLFPTEGPFSAGDRV